MVLIRRYGFIAAVAWLCVPAGTHAQSAGKARERLDEKVGERMSRFGAALAQGFGAPGFSGGPRPLLFGFALECTRCQPIGPRGGVGGGPRAVWHYAEYPQVAEVVEGGPAQRAGIRAGDVLLDVDGMSLLTDDGAERFSSLRAGDQVSLKLDRSGKTYSASLTLGRPMGRGRTAGPPLAAQPSRFTTRVGNTAVDVTSDVPVVASTDSAGTTLRIGSTTIRLKPASAAKTP